MKDQSSSRARFSAAALKYAAIAAMLIDHIAWRYVPLETAAGFLIHVVGRITMPIMCFFIAEGFRHTRDIKKYLLRLALLAVVSQAPYSLFMTGSITLNSGLNVAVTHFFGLAALCVCKSGRSRWLKAVFTLAAFAVTAVADWGIFGVAYILIFGLIDGDFKKQAALFFTNTALLLILSVAMNPVNPIPQLFHAGTLLALPLIYLYSGGSGGTGLWSKWMFYGFYPLHLLVLGLL